MAQLADSRLHEAFNSMLRTDYISLNDAEKLALLSQYYVDYFGLLPEVLGETDQLIVGRRGTGKTTLLYRALVGCMESWSELHADDAVPGPRTLGARKRGRSFY
jgi:predicted NACHT family NTPase